MENRTTRSHRGSYGGATRQRSSAGCAVKSFNVFLDISMTFPQWTNDSAAAPQLVQHWRTYYSALVKHEEGHKAIASGAAADIREAGSKIPSQLGCNELAKAIEKITGEIREREYDRDTDHGRTQGARFP
jgi:predicted secreted Zn-dependent protease